MQPPLQERRRPSAILYRYSAALSEFALSKRPTLRATTIMPNPRSIVPAGPPGGRISRAAAAQGVFAAGPSRTANPMSSPPTNAPPRTSSGKTLAKGALRKAGELSKVASALAASASSTSAETKSSARPLMQ
eukprot:scaffold68748_cov29-Tisochrysis_lutea.AAC.1